jgi:hypothetical protein
VRRTAEYLWEETPVEDKSRVKAVTEALLGRRWVNDNGDLGTFIRYEEVGGKELGHLLWSERIKMYVTFSRTWSTNNRRYFKRKTAAMRWVEKTNE